MRLFTLGMALLVLWADGAPFWHASAQAKGIEVSVNLNVETVACLFSLTEQGASQRYGFGFSSHRKEVMARFAYVRDHAAVEMSDEVLERGVWAPPLWVALNSSSFPNGRLVHDLPPWVYQAVSSTGDIEDGRAKVAAYIQLLNNFYRDAGLDTFYKEKTPFYRRVEGQVKRNLPPEGFIGVMESYYGMAHARYVLVPSPAILEFAGIGVAVQTEEGTEVYNVFGASLPRAVKDSIEAGTRKFDPDDFAFDDPERIRELSVHEFGHAFINPVAERYRDQLNRYSYLYAPIRKRMSELTYQDWWDCAVEHIVRAGEIQIAKALGEEKSAQRLMKDYTERYQFIYLPQIVSALEKYEQNRLVFPTIEAYFPELVKAFDDAAQE